MHRSARRLLRAVVLAVGVPAGLASGALAQDAPVETKQYDDGSFYEGTFKDGRQHGTGTIYLAQWLYLYRRLGDGRIRGNGVARYPTVSVYEGQFVRRQARRKGQVTYASGGSYEGDWTGGRMTGTGVARYPDGRSIPAPSAMESSMAPACRMAPPAIGMRANGPRGEKRARQDHLS